MYLKIILGLFVYKIVPSKIVFAPFKTFLTYWQNSRNQGQIWVKSHPGLEKMYFSREDSYISHYFLCISLLKNTKFPTKWSHFPGRSFLISTFFPTMVPPWIWKIFQVKKGWDFTWVSMVLKNGCYGYQNEYDPKWHFLMVFLWYFNADGIGIILSQISIALCHENRKGAVCRDIWPLAIITKHTFSFTHDWFLFLNKKLY